MSKAWRRWRLLILAVVVVALLGLGLWIGLPPTAYRIRISRETTYHTAPLRPDGTVDYLAIVNARLSEGLTPQNNAFGLVARAFGPGWDREEGFVDRTLAALNLPPLPQDGQYLQTWPDFVKDRASATDEQEQEVSPSPRQDMWGQLDEAMTRPWRKKEFPLLAEFLQVNAAPLELVTQATQRPRYYAPRVPRGDHDRLCTTWGPDPILLREAMKYLVARAMNRLAEGDIEGAWDDLMTYHRLALLVSQDTMNLGLHVAMAMEINAHRGDIALASSGKLSYEQAIAMARDLQGLGELPDLRVAYSQAERLCALDRLALCATEGLVELMVLTDEVRIGGGERRRRPETSIDWNKALVAVNAHFDRCEQALAQPRYADRIAALEQIDSDVEAVRQRLRRSERSLLSEVLEWLGVSSDQKPSLRTWRARIARDPGGYAVCILGWSFHPPVEEIRYGAVMRRRLTVTAFALAAHKAKNGSYPDALAALSPGYLKEVPLDGFADAPLIYKRAGNGYLLYSVGPNMTDDGGEDYDRLHDDLVVEVEYPQELRVGPEELW